MISREFNIFAVDTPDWSIKCWLQ